MRVLESAEAVAIEAALLVARTAESAVAERGRFVVALSGGSTPTASYALLGQPPLTDTIDWSCTHLVWGDERCVGPDDDRNNARTALVALGDVAQSASIHRVECDDGVDRAADRYDRTLRRVLAGQPIDLVLLGVGSDGHTASLFPGSPRLDADVRIAVAVDAPDHMAPSVPRVTLTLGTINAARTVIFLATGADKAAIVRRVLAGPGETPALPAARVNPDGELIWLLDQESAAGLAPSDR